MDKIKHWNGIGVTDYRDELLLASDKLAKAGERYQAICDQFFSGDNECLKTLETLAGDVGVHKFTANFIMLSDCLVRAYDDYKKKGYSDEQYFANLQDIRYKFKECLTVHGVPGTFVPWWNHGWIEVKRFTLGRFQYERFVFDLDDVTFSGITTKNGDTVYNFHIPSSGEDMSEQARIESYKKAYEFFRDELPADGILRLVCRSWLLWPGFKKMLGEKSNILSFASDFHILKEEIYQVYNDYWRVFGKDYTLPPDKLPRNNSLQRGMADVIVRGENIGWGYGLILFDGEKIVR